MSDESEREARLQEVMVACLEAAHSGRTDEARALVARHPEFAAELEELLAGRAELERLAGPLRDAHRPAEPPRVQYLGDYELLAELGRGGMGIVYRARQVSLNREVAVKVIRPTSLGSAEQVRRFRTEAEAAARLDHSGIVPVYEVGECEGQQFYSMKLVPGPSLAGALQGGQRLTPTESARFVRAVAAAVAHAHSRGVLHRDLKPANILIDPDGRPLVTDFGLARLLDRQTVATLSGAVVGTVEYMSPEQARGDPVSTASDVYGLGAVLYELLTGTSPHRRATPLDTFMHVRNEDIAPPRSRNPEVARDLETICLKCLDRRPGRRYATAEELADDLERWLDGRPIRGRRVGAIERVWLSARRRPTSTALALVAAALGATILFVAVLSACRPHEVVEAPPEPPIATGPVGPVPEDPEVVKARVEREQALIARRKETERKRALEYLDDVSEARRAWDLGDLTRVRELLAKHAPVPPGEADVRGWEWHWLSAATRGHLRDLPAREGFGNEPKQLAWSPSGELLAVGYSNEVEVWEPATGKKLFSAPNFIWGTDDRWKVLGTPWSPDGSRLLLFGGSESFIGLGAVVLDARTGQRAFEQAADLWATWTPDGRVAANARVEDTNGMFAGSVGRVWDKTGKRVGDWAPMPLVTAVSWSPTGNRVLFGRESGHVAVDANSGTPLAVFDRFASTPVWGPDGRLLAQRSSGGELICTDVDGGTVWRTKPRTCHAVGMAWSPDGARLACIGESGNTVEMRNGLTGERLWSRGGGANGVVRSFVWAADGRLLFLVAPAERASPDIPSLARSDEVVALDGATGNPARTTPADRLALARGTYIGFRRDNLDRTEVPSPNGRLLAFPRGNRIQLWDATALRRDLARPSLRGTSAEEFQLRGQAQDKAPTGLVLETDSQKPNRGVILETGSGRALGIPGGGPRNATWAAPSPDGKWIVTGASDQTGVLRVLSAATGAEAGTLYDVPTLSNRHVVWSPDGKRLAYTSRRGVIVWDTATRRVAHDLPVEGVQHLGRDGAAFNLLTVLWSRDCTRVAFAGLYLPTHIWDAASGKVLFADDTRNQLSVAYGGTSWDTRGRLVRTCTRHRDNGSVGHELHMWNPATGSDLVTELDGAALGSFSGVAVSPDGGRSVVCGSRAGKPFLELRDSSTGKPTVSLEVSSSGTPTWSPDGKHVVTYDSVAGITRPRVRDGQTLAVVRDVATDTHLWRVIWSPDGQHVAWTVGRQDRPGAGIGGPKEAPLPQPGVRAMSLATGEAMVLSGYPNRLADPDSLAWSADGKRIAWGGFAWDFPGGARRLALSEVALSRWCPDGRLLTVANGGAELWDVGAGARVFQSNAASLYPTRAELSAWAPDGRRLAWTAGGRIGLWDADGPDVIDPREGTQFIDSARWSPAGNRLALSGEFSQVLDADTGKEVMRVDAVGLTQWSADGGLLGNGAEVRDTRTGQRLAVSPAMLPADRLSPDGRWAAIMDSDGGRKVSVWARDSLRLVSTMPAEDGDAFRSLVWSPDGRRLVTASARGLVQLWDATTGRHLHRFEVVPPPKDGKVPENVLLGIQWSSDGKLLRANRQAGFAGSEIRLWDTNTGKSVFAADFKGESGEAVWSADLTRVSVPVVQIEPDTMLRKMRVEVTDTTSGKPLQTIAHEFDPGFPTRVVQSWARDGKHLAIVDRWGDIRVWEPGANREVWKFAGTQSFDHRKLEWSPDGKRLAQAGPGPQHSGGRVKVWDFATGNETILTCEQPAAPAWFGWSADGKFLAALAGGTVEVWDAQAGQCVHKVGKGVRPNPFVGARAWRSTVIAWSPDGKKFAVADERGAVRVRKTGPEVGTRTIEAHDGSAFGLGWSTDGKRLGTVGEDGLAKVWDAETGRELVSCRFGPAFRQADPEPPFGGSPVSVGWSADLGGLAVAQVSGTVTLFEVATGRETGTLQGHREPVFVAWSPDGRRVASGSSREPREFRAGESNRATVRIWDAATGKELFALPGFGPVRWSPDGWGLQFTGERGVGGVILNPDRKSEP